MNADDRLLSRQSLPALLALYALTADLDVLAANIRAKTIMKESPGKAHEWGWTPLTSISAGWSQGTV